MTESTPAGSSGPLYGAFNRQGLAGVDHKLFLKLVTHLNAARTGHAICGGVGGIDVWSKIINPKVRDETTRDLNDSMVAAAQAWA